MCEEISSKNTLKLDKIEIWLKKFISYINMCMIQMDYLNYLISFKRSTYFVTNSHLIDVKLKTRNASVLLTS